MEFGVVVQTDPPGARTVALAELAEQYGFSHFWTFDSHILWQEPYVLYSRILERTRRLTVGPMVTNPATRDWSVTASTYATLNDMYGNRTICGIGRGDSALRVTNQSPTTLKTLRESIHVIRELANSRPVEINGTTIQFPWSHDSLLQVWVAAYGPLALKLAGEVGDGYILQLADPDITDWMISSVRTAAADAGRDADGLTMCVAAPMYVTDGSEAAREHARDQCRWFGGMVGNHVADIVDRYGNDAPVPRALTDYIRQRKSYDYNEHGRAGNAHTSFVPDEIIDRFCIIGTVEEHVERLRELQSLGMHQFAGYLQHDNKEQTLRAYGESVIPALRAAKAARN